MSASVYLDVFKVLESHFGFAVSLLFGAPLGEGVVGLLAGARPQLRHLHVLVPAHAAPAGRLVPLVLILQLLLDLLYPGYPQRPVQRNRSCIIITCFGFIETIILGFTYYFGYRMDGFTQMGFLLSIGFSVDFLLHISQSFL